MPEPVIIATWSFAAAGCAEAWPALDAGGAALDAVERVAIAAESDPAVDSVGFGGLPDRDGRVTLDACVMLAPSRSGGVCAVERHLGVATLARRVMERTPHVLLAGRGADGFADELGHPESALLAEAARERWEAWRRDGRTPDQSRDGAASRPRDVGAGALFGHPPEPPHDTIGALALDRAGVLAGACSTSGMPFKRPGRIGDSPIIGHGLYVHPRHGAATATGTGELAMGSCAAFLAVERLRAGDTPLEAVVAALDRVREDHDLGPGHQLAMIALAPDGSRAAAALRPGFRAVAATAAGVVVTEAERTLLPGT